MKRFALSFVLGLFCLSFAGVTPTFAQKNAQTRKGFWFNGGLGYGSLGCDGCASRTGAVSWDISLGGTINPKAVLGVGTSGWTKSQFGATLTVGTLDLRARFYPASKSGFFLTGGVGVGSVSTAISGIGSGRETGLAILIGLGYDFRVAPNVSVTPFWNGFALRTSNTTPNVGQIGVGITVH
jgi:hypothetical protein